MKKIFGFIFVLAIIAVVGVIAFNIINRTPSVYYTVNFNLSEYTEGTAPTSQSIESGEKISVPTSIARTGYNIEGWYTNIADSNTKWNFSSNVVSQDITLYAKWQINTYPIYFSLNSKAGTAPNSQTIIYSHTVSEPPTPTCTGYDFAGWYTASTEGTLWNFSEDTVSSSITLYAHWTDAEYAVSYDLAGGTGSIQDTQTMSYMNKLAAPVQPTKSGVVFSGWWAGTSVDNYTQEWNFDSDLISSDITLYAGWGTQNLNSDYSFIELANCIKILAYVSVTIPEDEILIPTLINNKPVLSIGIDAFNNIDDSQNIILPSTLTTICEKAFYSCDSLSELVIPDSVTSIGKMAFDSCSYLYSLDLGSGVKNIAEKAFYQCTNLCDYQNATLTIPSNVLMIEKDAFSITGSAIYNLVLQNGLVYIGEEAFSHANIIRVDIPDSVETIGRHAFAYCTYLTKIEIGTGIKSIDYEAFTYTNVNTLYVIINSIVPPTINYNVFGSANRNSFWITVPVNSYDAYNAAANWNTYYTGHITTVLLSDETIIYPNR